VGVGGTGVAVGGTGVGGEVGGAGVGVTFGAQALTSRTTRKGNHSFRMIHLLKDFVFEFLLRIASFGAYKNRLQTNLLAD